MNAPFPGQNDGWQQGQQPQQPQPGQPYSQPQQGQPQYGQPQYGQPQYGQPQYGQPQYGQPQYGQPQYGQPGMPPGQYVDVTQNLSLNFWLSAFFSWLPAVIFFLMDKDKVPTVTRSYDAANLNFQLLRTVATFVAWLVTVILLVALGGSAPGLLFIILWLAIMAGSVYLFVLQIMAAIKVEDCARRGEPADNLYPFNIHWVS